MKIHSVTELIDLVLDRGFIKAVFSSPNQSDREPRQKVTIRPVFLKELLHYQITSDYLQKSLHQNVSSEQLREIILTELVSEFKQATFFTSEHDYHLLLSKKNKASILTKKPTHSKLNVIHNRKKNHILPEGKPIPFMIELGLMTLDGKIVAKKSDKFHQVNRFLELVCDVLPHLPKERSLNIIDFGCGKAYLTFALYHYLHVMLGYEVDFIGLDLKKEVIEKGQNLAKKVGFSGMHFEVGEIQNHQTKTIVDMVITLHACNTATDAALEKAIRWNASVILSVPCCHHELFHQIKQKQLVPLLKHGILKERFAALATDAARAQLLEVLGYQTQVVEFIDSEHTAKNILIRAVRSQKNRSLKELWSEYLEFKKLLNLKPILETMLSASLEEINLQT